MTQVSDDFNRANSTNIGASWTEVVGNWEIASNLLACNDDDGATGYYARYESDVGSSNMYAELVVTSTHGNASSNTGPSVRMRSAANTSYQFAANLSDSHAFWRTVAGAETQITTFSAALASGDTLRLEAVGETLRAKINGTLVGLARDTNITDGQRGGCNGYNNVGSDVVRCDNFEAGAITDDPPLAPYVVGWSAFFPTTSNTNTPTIPPVVADGDRVYIVHSRRDEAQASSAPANQGWSVQANPNQTGLRDTLWGKVWGVVGQTDDTTPSFTVTSGAAGHATVVIVVRNPEHATDPWVNADVTGAQTTGTASSTMTAPSATATGTHQTVLRIFTSADDNEIGTASEGALAFGGPSYDTVTGNDQSVGMSVLEDVTLSGSTGTATMAQGINGPDIYNAMTVVVSMPVPATVTPSAIAVSTSMPQPSAAVNAGPAVIATTATLPAPTLAAGATAAPSPAAVVATLPAPTVSAATVALPATVTAAVALPAPTVSAGSIVAPAVLAATAVLPAPTVDAHTVTQPGVLTTPVSLPAPTVSAGATVLPAAIAAPAALPAPDVSGSAVTAPAALATTAALPTPTLDAHTTVTPSVLAATASLPTPTVDAHTVVEAAVVAVAALLPAPTVSGGATATPAALSVPVAFPAPTVNVGAGPGVLPVAATLPAPTTVAGSTVAPPALAVPLAFPAPAVDAAAGPSTLPATVALPAPTVDTGGSAATATPATLTVAAALPAVTVTAAAVASPALLVVQVTVAAAVVATIAPDSFHGITRDPATGTYREAGDGTFREPVAAAHRETGFHDVYREAR